MQERALRKAEKQKVLEEQKRIDEEAKRERIRLRIEDYKQQVTSKIEGIN